MSRLDQALEELDLENWLSSYAEIKSINPTQIKIRTCPECGNDKYKLYVETERKLFHCFRCDFGRGISDICVLMASISGRNINDIRLELAQTVVPSSSSNLEDSLNKIFQPEIIVPDEIEITEIPGNNNWGGITSSTVLNYAVNRGLYLDEISFFQLRSSLDLSGFKGPFLIFPIAYDSVPVNWQGRRITDKEPKYVSGNNIATWLWPIDSYFLKIIKEKKSVALVEGVFDVPAFWRAGIPALCTFGKKISDRQIKLLQTFGVKELHIAWDADARAEIEKAGRRLAAYFPSVRVIDLVQSDGTKRDPGNVLSDPSLSTWLLSCINSSMDVNGSEYLSWRLQNI